MGKQSEAELNSITLHVNVIRDVAYSCLCGWYVGPNKQKQKGSSGRICMHDARQRHTLLSV